MNQRALFVTFEGPDGSGKTSISTAVHKKLNDMGYRSIYTREPGGIGISEEIRDVILNPKNTNMDEKTEALLYAASRRQHLVEKVLPALEDNLIVICDRFIDSSLAYQGVGRGLGFDEVYRINEFAIEGHLPDLTVYLDISAEEGLQRIQNRAFKDRLDMESIEFHNRVYDGYQQVLSHFPERMVKVDASQSIDNVVEDALEIILQAVSHE